MLRIDGFYLYSGGGNLKPLSLLKPETKYSDAQFPLYIARGWLEPLITGKTVYTLKSSWQKGNELLRTIESAIKELEPALSSSPPEDKDLGYLTSYYLTNALSAFDLVFQAEMNVSDLFLVSKKPGYDTSDLIDRGHVLFPKDLGIKVPTAIKDADQAGRCIAFELPTAAGFHLHRVNEEVLRHYYDVVTNKKPKPRTRTIGAYLEAFKKHKAGDPKVLAALDSIRELHRNPLMHPEQSLENVEEAIALHGAINSVVVHMLKAIK